MKKIEAAGHMLSKSTFIRGMQCPRSLYLNRYHPDLRDEIDEKQQEILSRGIDAGRLARGLFPGGIDASPAGEPADYRQAVQYTQRLIMEGAGVIYEAAFQYNEVLCLADILVREDGGWNAYEVKSSTKISDTQIMDASLQYHVISNSGLELRNFYIVHINSGYVRRGQLDIFSLFTTKSVSRQVKKNQRDIRLNIERLKAVLSGGAVPEIDIGEYCTRPYHCDFRGFCWKHIPEYSVFDIPQIGYRAFPLYKKGIIDIGDIPDDYPLNEAQRLQIRCHRTNEPHIDPESINTFLETLSYPLYFMDFETFMPAVPLYDNSSPYQFIPFQYSLHYREKRNGDLHHHEYMAHPGNDPRCEFIERLIGDTREEGRIIVYNKSFEAARLGEIARDFPEYSLEVGRLIARITDLMIPFQKKYYYTPAMKGRYSIKYVLPALIPELSYDSLAIGNGRDAMNAFESLRDEKDKNKIEKARKDLLEYCKMDTFALVKLLEKLEEIF